MARSRVKPCKAFLRTTVLTKLNSEDQYLRGNGGCVDVPTEQTNGIDIGYNTSIFLKPRPNGLTCGRKRPQVELAFSLRSEPSFPDSGRESICSRSNLRQARLCGKSLRTGTLTTQAAKQTREVPRKDTQVAKNNLKANISC